MLDRIFYMKAIKISGVFLDLAADYASCAFSTGDRVKLNESQLTAAHKVQMAQVGLQQCSTKIHAKMCSSVLHWVALNLLKCAAAHLIGGIPRLGVN